MRKTQIVLFVTFSFFMLFTSDAIAQYCGNGIVETGEECDGGKLSCSTEIPGTVGPFYCTSECIWYDGYCRDDACGNYATDQGEVCDHLVTTCSSLNHGNGLAFCSFDCGGYDLSNCSDFQNCGNNTIEFREKCDGNSVSCASLGYGPGTADCRSDCAGFDASTCEVKMVEMTMDVYDTCTDSLTPIFELYDTDEKDASVGGAFKFPETNTVYNYTFYCVPQHIICYGAWLSNGVYLGCGRGCSYYPYQLSCFECEENGSINITLPCWL